MKMALVKASFLILSIVDTVFYDSIQAAYGFCSTAVNSNVVENEGKVGGSMFHMQIYRDILTI